MSCRTFHTKISRWLDGELDEREVQALKAHLAECPVCKRFYEESLTIIAGMRSKAGIRPPAEIIDRIGDLASGTRNYAFKGRYPGWLQLPVAAMLLLVAVGLGGISGTRLSEIIMAPAADSSLMVVSTQDDISIEDMISALDKE